MGLIILNIGHKCICNAKMPNSLLSPGYLRAQVCCAWQGIGERKTGLIGIHAVTTLCGWVLSAGQFLVKMPGSLEAVGIELGTAIV